MRRDQQAASIWIRLAKCYGLVLQQVLRSQRTSRLTLPQFDALAQLLRHPRGMTAGALSRALLVTAGNVTGIIVRLQARRLVRAFADPDDRRVKRLRLTPAGIRLARAEVVRHERGLRKLFAAILPREHARLRKSLDRLKLALESRRNDG